MHLENLDVTTSAEVDAELLRLLANRQALYDVSSELIMLDYRPEFAKLHRRGSRALGHELKSASLLDSLGHLFVYIHLAWETGILNTVHSCRRQGVSRQQLLDVLMAGQLTGGPRGAENTYRAIWMMLRDYRDREEPAEFPDGGFRAGIRENVLLARAWGVRREYVVHAITSAAYYMNGLPAISVASEAARDLLENWE